MYLGVTDTAGETKILNLRYLDIEAKQKTKNVKSISFSSDSRHLLAGCSDGSYYFIHNVRPEGYFSKITKLGLLLMIIIYITHFFT